LHSVDNVRRAIIFHSIFIQRQNLHVLVYASSFVTLGSRNLQGFDKRKFGA